jgi:hypothetical protein
MTSTELAPHFAASLPDKIEYAKFLAKSGLLPQSYREHPENILFAAEYAELLGLHPMAAITGVHVIDGRPSISAGLISALVRRAGHRIRVQGDGESARCEIVRSDDPGFTYSAEWNMARAKTAGLLSRTNWQHYPAAMLKARAVSECARDACQEVLLGIAYTPDELGHDDDGGEVVHDGFPAGRDGALAASEMTEDEKDAAGLMPRRQRVEHAELRRAVGERTKAAGRSTAPDPDGDPWTVPGTAGQALDKAKDKFAAFAFDAGDWVALVDWLVPAFPDTPDVRVLTSFLDDHLKVADGDVEAARSAVWEQCRAAHEETAGDG